ncbi:hypothetical protein [Bartonella harrusi]|uniref:hypothetical protein n=1 Tax=Bartonella harrusi TaxID=2961895 RepID=UPI0020C8C7F4|nr:hypothetical protein [Bartonella harrusi]
MMDLNIVKSFRFTPFYCLKQNPLLVRHKWDDRVDKTREERRQMPFMNRVNARVVAT